MRSVCRRLCRVGFSVLAPFGRRRPAPAQSPLESFGGAPGLFRLLVLCLPSLLAGGCVQTATLPAQQLEAGTTVAAVTLDEPGILFVPRVGAQVTHGIGDGDLSVNVSGPPRGGGLSGRYYLSRQMNLELQLQGARIDDSWTGLALVGLQEAPTGPDPWYLGGQFGVISGRGNAISNVGPSIHQTVPVAGGSIGHTIDVGRATQVQVELEANLPLSADEPPLPASRLSVGLFHFFR